MKTIIVLILILGFSAQIAFSEDFWVSFADSGGDYSGAPGGPIFLMKITSIGEVVNAPKKILTSSKDHFFPVGQATALSYNSRGQLQLWFTAGQNPYQVLRVNIDPETINVGKVNRTGLHGVAEDIHISDKSCKTCNDLLTFDTYKDALVVGIGRPLTPTGFLLEHQIPLFTFNGSCEFPFGCALSIAKDGQFVVMLNNPPGNKPSNILSMRLFHNHPVSAPVQVAAGPYYSATITNRLTDGNRLITYIRVDRDIPTNSKLLAIRVSGQTGKKVAGPYLIARGDIFNSVVDQGGRFVVYISEGNQLFYQAIDENAKPTGNPKFLSKRAATGLSILKALE